MGTPRTIVVPPRDADHGMDLRALAGRTDLERTLHGRGCGPRARPARWNDLDARGSVGTGRRLFPARLPSHLPRLDRSREQGALDEEPGFPRWVVMWSAGRRARARTGK